MKIVKKAADAVTADNTNDCENNPYIESVYWVYIKTEEGKNCNVGRKTDSETDTDVDEGF